jgi:hypothetical protein
MKIDTHVKRKRGGLFKNSATQEAISPVVELARLSLLGETDYLMNNGSRNMKSSQNHDERIAKMTFAFVYPYLLAKVEKKGRTKAELHQVIRWLTGYTEKKLQKQIDDKVTYEQFFRQAKLNSNAHLITGVICGYRVEEIENPLTQQARYLDKLVDELAKGRKMEKILRTE